MLEALSRCELFGWRGSPAERLAEIIVLDQFSRNVRRGTPRPAPLCLHALYAQQVRGDPSRSPAPVCPERPRKQPRSLGGLQYTALHAMLDARQAAGLTQAEVASRMGTTVSAVSRLEASLRSEKHSPSFATLRKYAQACGKKLMIQMV